MIGFIHRPVLFCAVVLTAISLVSCSGGGNWGTTGTLELSLIDSPDSYQEVVITINEVQVHHEINGWLTLPQNDLDLPRQINLLELVNGAIAYLGATELETGHYTQMRLILDDSEGANYLVTDEGTEPLEVPGGGNTGVKLVNGFDINARGATDLVLDFDVDKSIVKAGRSGKYLLKPTIKVVDAITNSVSGVIQNTEDDPLDGASVSAQTYSGSGELNDEALRVSTAAGTRSELGEYFMYLPLLAPGDDPYNIVATKDNYYPACLKLNSSATGEHVADFLNMTESTGDAGTFLVSLQGLGNEEAAVVSFRKSHESCGVIEVASYNLSDTEIPEAIILPAGSYRIVVSAEGWTTQYEDHDLIQGEEHPVDITFTN